MGTISRDLPAFWMTYLNLFTVSKPFQTSYYLQSSYNMFVPLVPPQNVTPSNRIVRLVEPIILGLFLPDIYMRWVEETIMMNPWKHTRKSTWITNPLMEALSTFA